MSRDSKVQSSHDDGGDFEVEVFGCDNPKAVVVCSHGNGVRRWDGEKFFYAVAKHYPDRVFMLVDQNQPYEDGCKLNALPVMITRVQGLIDRAGADYPGVPVVVLGHSMGCGVISQLDLGKVAKVIFVAPAAGEQHDKLAERYGGDVLQGKVVKTSDGLTKFITKEFVESVRGIVWEQKYVELLKRYQPVYVFESGEEEIVSDERFKHRDLPFAGYKVVPGATHNLQGEALRSLYTELDGLL